MIKLQFSSRTDEQLAEILRVGDRNDREIAFTILVERHERRLRKSLARKMPKDWVDDVLQQVWLNFDLYSRRKELSNVGGLLTTLAERRRIDELMKGADEEAIELDRFIMRDSDERLVWEGSSPEDVLARQQEQLEREYQIDYVAIAPFIEHQLSSCQRVIWTLNQTYQFPAEVISRLFEKAATYSHVYNTRKKLMAYFSSDEFKMLMDHKEDLIALDYSNAHTASFVVDIFSEPTTPNLTPDELKPLGLSLKEFKEFYDVSIMLPRWYENQLVLNTSPPSLLLVRKEDRQDWLANIIALAKDPDLDDFLFPRCCFLKFDIDGKDIILTPEPLMEFVPDFNFDTAENRAVVKPDPITGELPDLGPHNTFLAPHKPRSILPVMMASLDSSLYDETVYKEWPFLRNVEGW